MSPLRPAPALTVSEWLNTSAPLSLESFRGRVVVIEAFQMLCPGCVSHGLPQAQRVRETFDEADVAVIGLHTVFEHFEAQGSRVALEAFLHEYRLRFPIGVDARDARGMPITMQAYGMQGTPTLVLIDRQGYRRMQTFGQVSDLRLGAAIMSLVAARDVSMGSEVARPNGAACDDHGCAVSA